MPPRVAGGASSKAVLESRIPQIIAMAEAETQRLTQEVANRMVHVAKEHSREDTGAMKAGWQSRKAPGSKTYEVFNPVRYTIFNEYGTINMEAQPMLEPAMAEARIEYPSGIRTIWQQLAMGQSLSGGVRASRFTRAAERRSPGSTDVGG